MPSSATNTQALANNRVLCWQGESACTAALNLNGYCKMAAWESSSQICPTPEALPSGLKIASMAEAYDVGLAPHCPLGPIALASCLAVDFVSYNAVIQEQSMGIHYNKEADLMDYVINKEDFAIDNGNIKPLPKPGLGVVIDEEAVQQAAKRPMNWKNPIWRHSDGSIAEW